MKPLHSIVRLINRLILWGIVLIAVLQMAASAQSLKSENGDGGPAVAASINGPSGISIDAKGNVYIAEMMGRRVREVNAKAGLISTVDGNGAECCFKEGMSANSNALFAPVATAVDFKGNIYIADISAHVRRVDVTNGTSTTVISDASGDHGDKPDIALSLPAHEQVKGLAVDPSGVLYISGSSHGRIYIVANGVVSVFAGIGGHGFAGDGKNPKDAQFNWPMNIALDSSGALFVADYENCRIRKIQFGLVSTIAGTGKCGLSGDGGRAIDATVDHPSAVAVDGDGNVYFNAPAPSCVRRIDGKTTLITNVSGTCETKDGLTEGPSGLALDSKGNLYVTEFGTNVVRKVDAKTGKVTIFAGNGLPNRADALL
jgi:DNA-binding beta-propeller fold protein YncE